MDIRDRIRQIIDANEEMTVRNVSISAGLSDSALHKFLTGANKSITVDNLESIADALGVSFRWLMFGEVDGMGAANVVDLYDRIPDERKSLAIRTLEAFIESSADGATIAD